MGNKAATSGAMMKKQMDQSPFSTAGFLLEAGQCLGEEEDIILSQVQKVGL